MRLAIEPGETMMRHYLPIVLLALLAACGQHHAADDQPGAAANAFVPPPVVAATPMLGQEPTTPLTAYVGKTPRDAVEGVEFYDRTDVATALAQAVVDPKVRRHYRQETGSKRPIFARDGKVGAPGCDAGDCAARNWTFLVATASGDGEACYHDAATMGATSRWYAHGKAVARPGDCPAA